MVCCECMFSALAYASLSYILYRFFHGIYVIVYPYLIATPQDLHKLAGGAKWALVTGSTDGIGKAYALELGQKGFNLILVSRTKAKLDAVKEEINKECGGKVEIETIVYDFKNANLDDYKKELIPAIEKKDIGILVNNVGLAYEFPDHLHDIDLQRNTDITVVNTVSVSVLTAAVIPQMLARKAGIIVNVSSAAGYAPMPYFSIYSSTKAYVTHFGNILRTEYANSGIVIQTLCPLIVATNMSGKYRESMFALSPKYYAHSAIKTIGNAAETTGAIEHQIQASLFGLPKCLMGIIMKLQQKQLKSEADAIKQKAKQN